MNMDFIYNIDKEKPLDNMVSDGGFTGIFRTIGCVGDSLASGEFESDNGNGGKGYHDFFDFSWGQYLARMCGSKAINFSRGGMTAIEYCQSFADSMGYWNPKLACDAYIIALGCNDLGGRSMELGTANDIDGEEKETFAYYYCKIIERYKAIQPRAKFFLVTFPKDRENDYVPKHRSLLYDIAAKYDNTYVIDIYRYGPVYDKAFKDKFFLLGHMNPMGYLFTAKMFASYIDYIIRHNMDDFKEVGYIGTDLHA